MQVRVAGDWCVNLWERMDHETRLIPYILTGVSDCAPAVQLAALRYMDAVGAQYEKEKEKELKDTIYYNPEDLALPPGEYVGGPLAYLPAPFTGAWGLVCYRRAGGLGWSRCCFWGQRERRRGKVHFDEAAFRSPQG
jgi:hypothetical protein